ncbi:MAG: TIGR03618 family F420-dependent PPOX class oxidoreductase [Solirubrobacterales bacterium]|nr:TIGR03618 family F420-dependent PPOX class oxidoreductase [Solirubrobacterales bacterium]
MPNTTIPDSFRDLLDAPVASLTTIGKDGGPQATLLWFVHDPKDDKVKLSLNTDRVKTKNLLARPQVSLLILDPASQFRFIDIRGTASTRVDTNYAFADAYVKPKYNADVRVHDGPQSTRLVVTIEPKSVYAVKI